VCAPDDGWRYHPKLLEQFPDINKLCNVASFWMFIGISKKLFFHNYSDLHTPCAKSIEHAYEMLQLAMFEQKYSRRERT